MKKLFAFALTVCMVLSFPTAIFAAITPSTSTSSEDSYLYLDVDPVCGEITIPPEVQLSYDSATNTYKGSGEIIIDNALLGKNQNVIISAQSDFIMHSREGAQVEYNVSIGNSTNNIASGDNIATFGTSNKSQSVILNYSAQNPTYAGNYVGSMTFTISTPNLTPNVD